MYILVTYKDEENQMKNEGARVVALLNSYNDNVVDSVTFFTFILKLVETPGVCVCCGGGGVLRYFNTYIWLGPFLLVQILKFNIYLFFLGGGGCGFQKK